MTLHTQNLEYQLSNYSKLYDQTNHLCPREEIPFDNYISLSYYNTRKSLKYLKCAYSSSKTYYITSDQISIKYHQNETFDFKLDFNLTKFKGVFYCDLNLFDDTQKEGKIDFSFLKGPFYLISRNDYQLNMNKTGLYLIRCFKIKHYKKLLVFKDLITVFPRNLTQLVKIPNHNSSDSDFSQCENLLNKQPAEKMNVLILGFDDISKNNFKRAFPLSYSYLSQLRRNVIYDYFNAVSRYQFHDALSILYGNSSKLILKQFQDLGYLTIYNEDNPTRMVQNELGKDQSIDFSNFWLLYDKLINNKFCINGKHTYEIKFHQIKSLVNNDTNKNTNFFSFNYFNYYSGGNSLSYPDLMDREFKEMLENLENDGYLDNTMLIVFSDAGSMTSQYSIKSTQGRHESFTPLLSIRIPRSLSNTEYGKNVDQNKNRLVSHFDLHKTLQHFYQINKNTELMNQRNLNRDSFIKCRNQFKTEHGISLFEAIPVNRSCAQAMIPDDVCVCNKKFEKIKHERSFYSETKIKYFKIAKRITKFINKKISTFGYDCKSFRFQSVVSVHKISRILANSPNNLLSFSFSILLQPDNSIFEAEISISNKRSFEIRGDVTRTSQYDPRRYDCVHDRKYAGFCLCKV